MLSVFPLQVSQIDVKKIYQSMSPGACIAFMEYSTYTMASTDRPAVDLANGDWTRRDPQNGPFGIFITLSKEKSTVAGDNLRDDYHDAWKAATADMITLLWGGAL